MEEGNFSKYHKLKIYIFFPNSIMLVVLVSICLFIYLFIYLFINEYL